MTYETIMFEHGSNWYQKALLLRTSVLRKPLGLSYSQKDIEDEAEQYHLGLLLDGKIIGVVLLNPLNVNELKLRQFAIDPSFQGQGYGAVLLRYAEQVSQNFGYRKIRMHARSTAVNFYKKNGYRIVSKRFLEVGIPHYKMLKEF